MFRKCIYHPECQWELCTELAVSCENGSCLVHCSFLVSALQGKISNHPNPMCTMSCGAGLLLTLLCVFLFQGGQIPSLSLSSMMSWAWAGWRWRWAPLTPAGLLGSGWERHGKVRVCASKVKNNLLLNQRSKKTLVCKMHPLFIPVSLSSGLWMLPKIPGLWDCSSPKLPWACQGPPHWGINDLFYTLGDNIVKAKYNLHRFCFS